MYDQLMNLNVVRKSEYRHNLKCKNGKRSETNVVRYVTFEIQSVTRRRITKIIKDIKVLYVRERAKSYLLVSLISITIWNNYWVDH